MLINHFGLVLTTPDGSKLLLTLFVMFVTAKLAAELFERLKQPAVAGEIIAGVLIGPSVFALVEPTELTGAMAEIGVIFLLFLVGMETKPADIFRVGGRATIVALLGVIVPFICGFLVMYYWGAPNIESIFVGAAMVATSVGITARVLGQMGLLSLEVSRIILGAAVIDDILGLIILAVVSSMATADGINYTEIATTAALSIGFTLLIVFVGAKTVNRIRPRVERLKVGQSYLIFGFSLCLGLALIATWIKVAPIIGAFLAGMALSESTERTDMPLQAEAVTEFFLPFFLVNIGMQVQLGLLFSRHVLVLALIITVLAVLSKLIGCGLGASIMGRKKALQIGMGMVPRGEVGIVVAQIGLGLNAVSNQAFGIVLFMAVATTLIAPPFLVRLFRDEQRVDEESVVPVTSIS